MVEEVRHGLDGWSQWLTLGEVWAFKGLPEGVDLGDAETPAGKAPGRGVLLGVLDWTADTVVPV